VSLVDVSLGDALEVLIDHRGKTPRKLGGDWVDHGHRVVSALNIKERRVDLNDHHYVDAVMYRRWMPTPLAAGDVLLTSEAPLGEVAYLSSTEQWCVGQRLFALRAKRGLLDGRYLYYLLQTAPVRQQILSRASGSTVLGIRQAELIQVRLQLPSVGEQLQVAATLGAVDDKIELNRRTIEICAELFDATSSSLALDLDSVPLSALATPLRDAFNPSALGAKPIDHFSIPAFDAKGLPDRTTGASVISAKLQVNRPAVLVSRLNPRTNRTWFAVPEPGVTAGCSTEFLVLTPKASVTLGSLWLAVRDEGFRSLLAQRASGTSGSHQRVKAQDALAIEVPDVRQLPVAEAQAADELLWLMHQRSVESARLAALRDALLPELLSGRIRVPEAGQAVEAALA
jgi:type I restriction enzyme S subunit